jgi:alpha-tubulin suppressor-like RCC1 family protein
VDYPLAADVLLVYDNANKLYLSGGSLEYVSNVVLYKGETSYDATATVSGDAPLSKTILGGGTNYYLGSGYGGPRSFNVNNGDQTVLVAGAYGYNSNQGLIYIYERKSKNRGDWELKQTIYGNLGTNARFGGAVSINDTGDRIFVSADQYSSNTGRVLVYDRGSDGLFPDTPTHTLTGSNGSGYAFGFSIDCNGAGDKLIVGARNETATERGAHHLYELINGTWTRTYHRVEGNNNRRYGWAVAMNKVGDRIVVSGSYPNGWIWIFHYENGSWVQKTQISNPVASNEFGWYVSMNDVGDRVAVGCNTIRAYIYDYNGTSWSLFTSKTDNPTGHAGVTLTPKGDYIAIHGLNISPGGISSAGAAYIYQISDTGTLTLVRTFTGEASNDNLGWHVYMSDDLEVIVMGAKGNDEGGSDAGKLYVYSFDTWAENFYITQPGTYRADLQICGIDYKTNEVEVTGSVTPEKTWVNEQKLLGEVAGDLFGYSVSISGDYAIVGAYIKNSYKGAAYIYKRDGTTWTEQANFTGEAASDQFGYSVSISGDYAIVGAAVNDTGTGAAYIYTRSGTSWTQQQELNGEATSYFGWSVSISGDYAIVGAPYDDTAFNNAGAAYIFKRDGTTWTEQDKLLGEAASDQFGESVGISGDYAIVGAYIKNSFTGVAYIFKRDGTTWTEQANFDGEATSDSFGQSVSISGDYAIVGAQGNDTAFSNAGTAYIYKRDGTSWTQQKKLLGETADDYFGRSVSISGDYVIVGAQGNDTAFSDAGAAYIYKRDGTSWTQQKKLLGEATSDSFGWSVSISGDYAIVGAPYEDTGGGSAGAAYIYELTPVADLTFDGYNQLSLTNTPTYTSSKLAYYSNVYDVGTLTDKLFIDKTGEYTSLTFDTSSNVAYFSNVTVGAMGTTLADYVVDTTIYGTVQSGQTHQIGQGGFGNNTILNADGTRLLITDPLNYPSGRGRAYIYHLENGSWVLKQTWDNPNNTGQRFADGACMNEDGTRIFLMHNASEKVYTYEYTNGAWPTDNTGTHVITVGTNIGAEYEGLACNKAGDVLLMGHGNANTAYIYRRASATSWSQDSGGSFTKGRGVAMNGDGTRAFIGNSTDGTVHMTEWSGSTWSSLTQIIDESYSNWPCTMMSDSAGETLVIVSGNGDSSSGNSGIYERNSGDGTWSRVQGVNADTEIYGMRLPSISYDGTMVLVGSFRYDSSKGRAQLWQKSNGAWTLKKEYLNPDTSPASSDQFGAGCGIARTTKDKFVIGMEGDDTAGTDYGSVYVYSNEIPKYLDFDTYNKLSIQNITPTATTLKYGSNTYDLGTRTDVYIDKAGTYDAGIKASDKFALVSNVVSGTIQPYTFMKNVQTIYGASSSEQLGWSDNEGGGTICFNKDGTKLALSSFNAQKVYVYTLTNGTYVLDSGTPLTNSNHFFGYACSLNDDGTILATNHFGGSNQQTGDTYVYQYSSGSWSLRATFGGGLYYTKASVLDGVGNRVLASASGTNTMKIYDWNGSTYAETYSFSGSSEFANGMDMTRDGLIVGGINKTTNNTVKVWQYSGSSWSQMGSDVSVGNVSSFFRLNRVGGTRFIVSSPYDDTAFTDAGIVKVYDYTGGSWTNTKTFYGDSASSGLGTSINISDDGKVIISGGSTDDTKSTDAGVFYEFKETNGVWETKKFYDNVAGARFGSGIAMNSTANVYAIGAGYDDTIANNAGKVVIYKPENVFSFDGYNKLSIENITPTASTLRLGSNTYDIGTATDIYIEDTGTYEIETKDANTFALVSNTATYQVHPNTAYSNYRSIGGISAASTSLHNENITTTYSVTMWAKKINGQYFFRTANSDTSSNPNNTHGILRWNGGKVSHVTWTSNNSLGITYNTTLDATSKDEWHFYGFEFEGTTTKLHLDGAAPITGTTGLLGQTHNRIRFDDPTIFSTGSARLAEFAVYNRALSDAEFVSIYNNGLPNGPDNVSSGRVSWFKCLSGAMGTNSGTGGDFDASFTEDTDVPSAWLDPTPSLTHDTYNKLSIENITPTASTLRLGSNTYDIGTATDIYIEDTGTYEIETKDANTFAFTNTMVSGTIKTVEPVITGGYFFGHALTYDGKLYGWGENSSGELGVGDTTDKTVPTLCTGIPQGEIVSIWNQSIRGQSRWAKTRDGRIWVTGDHDSYCLPGSSSDFTTFTDVSVEFGDYTQTSNNVVWASGSERATQVLMENGDVWSFGDDTGSLGVLGQGASPTSDRTPRKLNVSNITKITYGGDLVLALDSSNVIWMWGRNEVGNSTLGWGPYNVPTNIMSTGTNSLTSLLATDSETVVDIESSYYSMFALTDKGTVYCTGHNASGQLGQGNATAKTSSDGWVKIEYFTSNAITVNKLYVGGGNPHVFADTSDGWYCWGENTTGELGLGDNTDKLSPVKFTGVSNIKKFGVGYLVSYAITEDGKYYAWGRGTNYARGDNTTGDITYPKHIDTLPNILAPSFEFDGYDKVFVNKDGGIKTWTSGPSYIDHIPGIGSWDNNTFMPLYKVSDDGVNAVYAIQTYSTDHSIKYTYATKIWSDNGSNHPHYVTSNTDDPTIRESTPNAKTLVAMQDNGNIFYKFNNPFYSDSFENTKYTKGTTTYDVGEASIITVPDPGTYDAQLKSLFNFSLKSTTIPATSSTGLYTWAFHHGNFDNAYGDGDILTARDNGRFYADTPSYTGDIGTITGSKGVPGASTQYPTGGWLTSSTSTQYPSINNNGFITQFTNYYNGMNSDNYKILDNNDTTSTYAPSDQGCAFSYYNNSEKVYIEKVYVDFGTGQPESETIFLLEYANDVSTVTSSTSINSRDSSILKVINSRNVWEITVNKALWKFHIDCYNNGNNKMGCSPYSMYWTAYTLGEDDGTIYTFTPASTLTANVLMVAGGGSGGSYNTGGGGAGGLVYKQNESISTGVKTIVVGNGGEAIANSAGLRDGLPGKDTTFLGYTAIGGGAHGDATSDDKSGGSGGAGAGASSSDALQPTSTTGGFGNQGGTNDSDRAGGGGGGAGGAGENGDRNTKAGDGGIGKNYGYIFGTNYGENGWFAGGGGGGDSDQWHSAARGFGGKGGGGHGVGTFDTGQYGQSHTGGGGGGSGQDSLNTPNAIRGGGGGSGIVLFQTNVETPNVNSEVKAPKPDGFLVYNDNLDLVSRGPIPGSYNSNTVKTVKLPDGSEGPVYYSASGYTYFGVQPSNTIQGDGSFQTVESVFMPISTGYYTHIASLMYSDSNLMTLGIDGNNKLNIQHNNNVSHNAVTTLTTSDYVMEHGKWYHLVLTTDYLGNAKAYVNGYLVASERWSSMNSDKRQVMFYRIGVDNHPTRTFLTSTSQCYYSELNKKEVMQLAESVGLGPKLEYDGLNAINVVNAEPGSGTEITIYESNVNDTSNLYVVSCNESSYLLSNAGTYYAQIKGTDTFTITRPLTVTDDHFPLYQYPPIDGTTSGLTESAAADTWSTWTISGASNGNGQYQAKTTHAPFSISFTAYRAFNNDVSDDNGQYVDASQKTNVGLTLQLPSAKTIRKYRMYPVDHSLSSGAIPGSSTDPTLSGGDPDYKSRPKSWILKGSSDGTNWTDLDTVTNKPISIYGDVYSIDSPASYQYYQMFVVNIVDTSALLRIGEWQLWGDA